MLSFIIGFIGFIAIIGGLALVFAAKAIVEGTNTDSTTGPRVGGVVILVVGLILFSLSFITWRSVPPQSVGLHYTGGPFQGTHYKEQLAPGTSLRPLGLMENFYLYPATTRNYVVDAVANQGDRTGADFIATTSSDKVEADWNIAVSFRLNTEPHVLRKFHEGLGLKFHAWTDGGWKDLLDQTLRQVIENKINSESSKYTLEQLYADPGVRLKIQKSVGDDLTQGVADLFGGKFFCGPNAAIGRSGCPPMKFIIKGRPRIPTELRTQFEKNRSAQLAVAQRQSEVAQAQLQAQAAEALRSATQGNEAYVLLKAIESGSIKFWVLPNNSALTLPTPSP